MLFARFRADLTSSIIRSSGGIDNLEADKVVSLLSKYSEYQVTSGFSLITILQASRMKSQSLEMEYVYKFIFEGLKSIDLFDLLWEEEDRLVTKIQRDLGITNQNKIIYQRVKKFEAMAPMAAPETYLPESYRRPNLLSLEYWPRS